MTVMEGETYAPQRAAFLGVVNSRGPDEIRLLGQYPDRHPSEVEALRAVANRYEYIATAIGLGALDYKTYKRLWRGSTLRDWERLEPFILIERVGYKNPNFWTEYERLVARLSKDKPG